MSSPGEAAPRKKHGLWPREHGAWMQLAFPIATALWVGRPTPAALALALSFFAAFTAHEPLLVLAGRRGARCRDELRTAALIRLGLLSTVALASGGFAVWSASRDVWIAIGAALAFGGVAIALALRGRERNVIGEAHAALSLVLAALPVALLAEVALEPALLFTGLWALAFLLGTLAARGVLIRGKDKGRLLRIALVAGLVSCATLGAAAGAGSLSPALALGPFVFGLVAIVLAIRPPSPKRMMPIGFGLMGACVVALVAFGLTLG